VDLLLLNIDHKINSIFLDKENLSKLESSKINIKYLNTLIKIGSLNKLKYMSAKYQEKYKYSV